MQWGAARKPTGSEHAALECPVSADGTNGVLRTRWVIATDLAQHRGQGALVDTDESDEQDARGTNQTTDASGQPLGESETSAARTV